MLASTKLSGSELKPEWCKAVCLDLYYSSSTFEKYADDIVCYLIGASVTSTLPQEVANAVQKWYDVNRMRLNAG